MRAVRQVFKERQHSRCLLNAAPRVRNNTSAGHGKQRGHLCRKRRPWASLFWDTRQFRPHPRDAAKVRLVLKRHFQNQVGSGALCLTRAANQRRVVIRSARV